MGKRRRPCWGLERELRDDIKSYYDEKDYLSVDEVVDRLRSSGKKYARLQLKPFTERVQNIVVQLEEQVRKKPKRNNEQGGDGDLSSTLSSKPPESDSDNAIYGEEKIDLFKSMLRTTYITQGGNIEEPENNDDKGKKKLDDDDDDMLLEGGVQENMLKRKPTFKDLGGMDGVLDVLERKVLRRLYFPDLAAHLGVKPISGILLHGPPGCGKTTLAHALANETKLPFYPISATALVSGISGASEENIRDLFSKAYRTGPSIVFIDEIDAIASKRENVQREMERRIVTQLLICMDGSYRPDDAKSEGSNGHGHVLVIGATNRPNAIDPALRRPGRFDREIVLPIPDEKARVQILSVLTRRLGVDQGAIDLMKIARSTPGFVGADLADLTNQACNLAMERITDQRKVELSREFISAEDSKTWWSPEEMEKLSINMSDFEEAAKSVQASTIREGFSTIPDVKWEDVGGLDSLRQQFDRYIVRRIKYPEYYMGLGMGSETGFLLYGPPGCGKTLIAKAVAHEAGANFIYIQGPEILNKYVGESELAIRTLFNRARTCSPCILFFDEVDALTTKRGKEGGWVVERLLNQLLVELDGADQRNGVYVIGATNRPEVMDEAVLRPGRLGRLIYVPLPSPDERGLILKALAREKPIDTSVDLMKLGRDDACKNLSGADLSLLMSEALEEALQDWKALDASCGDTSLTIKESHFKRALEKISPSVTGKQIKYYQRLSKSLKAA